MGEERRLYERVRLPLEVRWEGLSGRHAARVYDLDLGGCYVETLGQVQAGERVRFEVQSPTGRWLGFRGEIVHAQPADSPRRLQNSRLLVRPLRPKDHLSNKSPRSLSSEIFHKFTKGASGKCGWAALNAHTESTHRPISKRPPPNLKAPPPPSASKSGRRVSHPVTEVLTFQKDKKSGPFLEAVALRLKAKGHHHQRAKGAGGVEERVFGKERRLVFTCRCHSRLAFYGNRGVSPAFRSLALLTREGEPPSLDFGVPLYVQMTTWRAVGGLA
jgi:hypothetical protein